MSTVMESAVDVKQFEVGQSYTTRFASDYDMVAVITVTKRTAKTLWFEYSGEILKRRIHVSEWSSEAYEMVSHGNYSMALCWSAIRRDRDAA